LIFVLLTSSLRDVIAKKFVRPSKEPEIMCKLLFLEYLYDLSDEEVRLEVSLNLAYMYFIGLNPEDTLTERSLLSKFRRHHVGEEKLDLINTIQN
jgi:transposase